MEQHIQKKAIQQILSSALLQDSEVAKRVDLANVAPVGQNVKTLILYQN